MTPDPPPRFDPVAVLRALVEGGVDFVLVGGLAAVLRGAPTVTYGVDVAPAQDPANLERLVAVLRALGAVRSTGPDGDLEEPAVERLTEDVERFAAPVAYVDVLRELRAVGGFEALQERADRIAVEDVTVLVASLDDVIASKEVAGRTKDLAALPALHALRHELEDRTG